jgi:hypothetical protein
MCPRGPLLSAMAFTESGVRMTASTRQQVRKRIEVIFGWVKTTGGMRKTRHRGTALVGWMFTLAVAAYNLVRIPKLVAAPE